MEEVKSILHDHPRIDVNWRSHITNMTSLHFACEKGHTAIVALLLAHPGIDVNPRNTYGHTSMMRACWYERTSCVRLLLRDSRVRVNQGDSGGALPLHFIARYGKC